MRFWYIAIFILVKILISAEFQALQKPQKRCGLPEIQQFDLEKYLTNLKESDYTDYLGLVKEVKFVNQFNSVNKYRQMFWVYNFKTESYYSIESTLKKSGNYTKIWVEDESWNNGYVNDLILDELLKNLENISGTSSIDPNRGIIEIDTTLFGQPPNYDGDGIIDFLILDIQDNYDPDNNNSSFIAGYFSPNDQSNLATSNQRDILYLDAFPAIFSDSIHTTQRVLSTTAHEFQHLIHYNYDQNEAEWINEGLSELAGTYCGYGLDLPSLFLQDPNVNLTTWNDNVKDYSRVNLWTLYCAEQLGRQFIKQLAQIQENSVTGFNQAILNSGNTGTFQTTFTNWITANLINNINFDSRYGYNWDEARGLRVELSKITYEYPQINVNGTIKKYGAEYHRFRGQDSLLIQFLSGYPERKWIIGKGNVHQVITPVGMEISEPEFNEDTSYVLILFSTANDMNYNYDVYAKYSLRYFELGYDDGDADIGISFPSFGGFAANRFIMPEGNLKPESIRFWANGSNYSARIHLYANNQGNLPGTELISPLDTFIISSDNWITIDLNGSSPTLQKDEVIFAGIELNSANAGMGYDADLPHNGQSYAKIGNSGWRRLSEFNNGVFPGDWMIRATFTGNLYLSSGYSGTNFVLQGNYPNPFFAGGTETNIRYQIPEAGEIRLIVYNTLGQKVADIKEANPSPVRLRWNGSTKLGPLPSGIYFYQLRYLNFKTGRVERSNFQKMVILR